MGSEEPWLLDFPYPLALPISSFTLICNGSFGQGEEDAQRASNAL
jgi:hypothetical protein